MRDDFDDVQTVPKSDLERAAELVNTMLRPQGGKRSRRHRRTKSRKQKRSKKTRRRA